jgi:hypothetical protein
VTNNPIHGSKRIIGTPGRDSDHLFHKVVQGTLRKACFAVHDTGVERIDLRPIVPDERGKIASTLGGRSGPAMGQRRRDFAVDENQAESDCFA